MRSVPSLSLTGNPPGRPERTSLLQKVLSEVAPNLVPHKEDAIVSSGLTARYKREDLYERVWTVP